MLSRRVGNSLNQKKLEIIYNPGLATLNKRNELYNHCRHRDKVLQVKRKRKKRIPGE